MDTRVLEEIGLTKGEVRAYLALLELGSASTGPIAKEAGISRSKVYEVLGKLRDKGMVSQVEQNGVAYFQAAEPAKVGDYLNEREEKFREMKEEFEGFLPKLMGLRQKAGNAQSVAVYQGLKGLKTAHEHTYLKLKRGEEYCYLGIPGEQPESQHRYWQKDHERRAKAGIRARSLFNRDTPRRVMENRNSYRLSDARHMPVDMKTPAYFLIYKDVVMIGVPAEKPIAIEITSTEVANSFMAYFEEFWKRSRPFK